MSIIENIMNYAYIQAWHVIPASDFISCVKCKRAEFSFGGWLYQEI